MSCEKVPHDISKGLCHPKGPKIRAFKISVRTWFIEIGLVLTLAKRRPPRQDIISVKTQNGYRTVIADNSQTQDVAISVQFEDASATVSASILSNVPTFLLTSPLVATISNTCKKGANKDFPI